MYEGNDEDPLIVSNEVFLSSFTASVDVYFISCVCRIMAALKVSVLLLFLVVQCELTLYICVFVMEYASCPYIGLVLFLIWQHIPKLISQLPHILVAS